MSEKLWGGRFSQATHALMEEFNASIDVDKRLFAVDIQGSQAHVKMMAKQAIITEQEAQILLDGLEKVKEKMAAGKIAWSNSLEDIHMHVEAALAAECGDVAKKLHTGRSRNDQVALDIRIYLKQQTLEIVEMIRQFQKVLVDMAENHLHVIMPGYTHLQRAQPVLFSHHLMAYYEMFDRDTQRFAQCCERIDAMPLGAAALAGTTYPLDREYVAEVLGFSKVCENSMDAVSDRDFVMEFNAHAAIAMIHLSRLSEELILWSSSEFGFITISDAFTTGSSIMPQKKNPDAAELVRGKTGRVLGNLVSILTLMKSLPLAYNKDMQEDKEPVFDSIDTLKLCFSVYIRMFQEIQVNENTMRSACKKGFLNATDLADYLVGKGIAFRQAHKIAGQIVAFALNCGKEIDELSLDELQGFSDRILSDIYEYIDLDQMIKRRISQGGTGTDSVKAAVTKARESLAAYP